MTIECDVLIIGAGPAGSGAAIGAAQMGIKTICIDKKEVIGSPVECGEAVGMSLLKEFNIHVAPEAIYMKHDGTVFWSNQKVCIDNCSSVWKSMSVNRHLLDKSFAAEAIRTGAKVLVNTEFTDAVLKNNNIVSVTALQKEKKIEIKPQVVIAADGVTSKIAEIQGRKKFSDIQIGKVAGYEMANMKLKEPKKIQMFFEEMCGMGYGYIIPLSKNTANVGLGSLGIKKVPWNVFDEFLEEHPIVAPQVKNASIIEVKTGQAPISGPSTELVIGNTLFVGDAAGQNLSHVGEGAIPSHICGRIAGAVAAEAVKRQDGELLKMYETKLNESIGPLLDHCSNIREKIIQIWTSNLPVEKRFLIGSFFVSELVSPDKIDLIKKLGKLDTSSIIKEVNGLLKKQKLDSSVKIKTF